MKKSRTLIDLKSFRQQERIFRHEVCKPSKPSLRRLSDSFCSDDQAPTMGFRSSSEGNLALILNRERESVTDCCQRSHGTLNPMDPSKSEDQLTMKILSDNRPNTWNVGKISIFLLIFLSATDIILNLVDAQMESLEAPDHYDALSADVIRPAFRYHSANTEKNPGKPRLGLGSAAISSVTTALSPILPFTGGVDLRREDYWTNGVFGSMASVVEQVRDAFSAPSSPSVLNTPRGGGGRSLHKAQLDSRVTLSKSEPFVSLREIADLTLNDISMAFRYAVEHTRHDFNAGRFMSGLAPRAKKLFEKMSASSRTSRGTGVYKPVTGLSERSGDVDALEFCAAMRIFAEWRILRQVPDGYKGYAVGMNLGQKDVVQNVAKIEHAVHTYLQHRADHLEEGDVLHSPTLRDLLQYEIDTDVHDNNKLPRLKEKSAAMGLLWVRRQLHYQTALFAKVVQVPERYGSARDAVTAAYKEVYDKYHGWAVQKIFSYSFQAAPDAVAVYKVMNPRKLKEISESAKSMVNSDNSEQPRKLGRNMKIKENPFEKLGNHIAGEWEKVVGGVGQLFGHSAPRRRKVEAMRGGFDKIDAELQTKIDDYINQEISKDAHAHINAYLAVAEPILNDLATLFDELNMDDPTKV
mmetsp:Transcript_26200/g.40320  ORF Transcript_26200/g.40320 Transcript_26200/m.40320 type:complete len:636 (-) Transcript_26200:77-1984(-)